MPVTPNYGLPLPDPERNIDAEFWSLEALILQLDLILFGIAQQLAQKAATDHEQAISTITGLSEALAGKMAASATFKLDNLTDVSGADGAAVGYLLVKTPTGWQPSSAAAAIGEHQHPMTAITGLNDALTALDTALKSNGRRDLTISAADPVGGSDGDIHFKI